MIFSSFLALLKRNFRGFFLGVKASLRLATLGLDTYEKNLQRFILNSGFERKKVVFVSTMLVN